jgi:hypothetical protein
MPFAVRKPNAFLELSFATPLKPSTTPDEIVIRGEEPVGDQMPMTPY